MRRTGIALVALAIAVMIALPAEARQLKMIFWYPGEAGTSEEGQPVIDAFLDYLNGAISPDRIAGRYVNSIDGGLAYIKSDKPALGILSYAAWFQNRAKFPNAAVILSTLPLPSGQSTESYELVSGSGKIPAKAGVISSEPLTREFVRSELFPEIPGDASFARTGQMIFKLKEIGEGKSDAVAILTPVESAALSKISASWAAGVKRIRLSKALPTARVVLFDPSFDASKIKAALLSAGSDPKAKEILTEMRLKGFSN